jgi:hypothetical protein
MGLYVAYNQAFSTTTGISAGTSYATGAKVAIQLATPATARIRLVEWGISFDGSAAATPAIVEIAKASAASTVTAHSTTTVQNISDGTFASRLTMSTTGTGYGAVAITTNTTTQVYDKQYIAPTNQYVKQWPLGREPTIAESSFVQLRLNTTATVNAVAYIVWEEA